MYKIVNNYILNVNRQLQVQDDCCNTLPSINREFGYIVNLRKKLLEVLCNLNLILKNNDLSFDDNFANIKKENHLNINNQLYIATKTLETIGQSKLMRHPLLSSVYITLSTEATLLKRLIYILINLNEYKRDETLFHLWMAEMEFNSFQKKLKNKYSENTAFYEWLFKFKSCIFKRSEQLLLNVNREDLAEYNENEIISSAHIYYLIDTFVSKTNSFVAFLLFPKDPTTVDSFRVICQSGVPPGSDSSRESDTRPTWKLNLVSLLMFDQNIEYFYDSKLEITFFIKKIKEKEVYITIIFNGEIKKTDEMVNVFFKDISECNAINIF